MYIHIGNDFVVNSKDIVGLFDIDNCSVGKKTRIFFAVNQKNNRVVTATDDLPKSFVVTKDQVLISGVSTATLRQRAEKGNYDTQE